MIFKRKHKIERDPVLELMPLALTRGDSREQKLMRLLLAHANPRDLKRLFLALAGCGAAVSLAGSLARNRMLRSAVSRELKKQLAPVNKKLDELEKQNEELKKQNQELKKKLS